MVSVRSLALIAAGSTLASVASLLSAAPVDAHGIETNLEALQRLNESFAAERLQLESRFSTGEPASDAAVRLLPPDGGQPIEVGRTDAAGQLRFDLPPRSGTGWELQVDAGPGHRDYLELPVGRDGSSPSAHSRPVLAHIRRSPLSVPTFGALGVIGMIGIAGIHRWRSRA
jgi:nickel transport protein